MRWICVVTSPARPAPTLIRSTLRTGVTSDAVPVRKISSPVYSISRGSGCSRTAIPASRASVMMLSRVMPCSSVPLIGVV